MLSRALIMITVAAAAVAFVFESPTAIVAAAVLTVLVATARGLE